MYLTFEKLNQPTNGNFSLENYFWFLFIKLLQTGKHGVFCGSVYIFHTPKAKYIDLYNSYWKVVFTK